MGIWRTISSLILIKSMLLGLIVLGLWARSYFIADGLLLTVSGKSVTLSSASGVFVYRAAVDGSNQMSLTQMRRHFSTSDPAFVIDTLPSGGHGSNLGFLFDKSLPDSGGMVVTLTIPHWFLFLVVGGRALYWMARRGARQCMHAPRASGWCVNCQYEVPSVKNHCVRCGTLVSERIAA